VSFKEYTYTNINTHTKNIRGLQDCRGYGDSHGYGCGMGMGMMNPHGSVRLNLICKYCIMMFMHHAVQYWVHTMILHTDGIHDKKIKWYICIKQKYTGGGYGYGVFRDSVDMGIPTGFSVGMGWVWALKFTPRHGSPLASHVIFVDYKFTISKYLRWSIAIYCPVFVTLSHRVHNSENTRLQFTISLATGDLKWKIRSWIGRQNVVSMRN